MSANPDHSADEPTEPVRCNSCGRVVEHLGVGRMRCGNCGPLDISQVRSPRPEAQAAPKLTEKEIRIIQRALLQTHELHPLSPRNINALCDMALVSLERGEANALARRNAAKALDAESALAEEKAARERDHDWIARRGYRRCDIPACNCGMWHGGNVEARLDEIKDALTDADVELNGTTILTAIKSQLALVASLRARVEAGEKVVRELVRLYESAPDNCILPLGLFDLVRAARALIGEKQT